MALARSGGGQRENTELEYRENPLLRSRADSGPEWLAVTKERLHTGSVSPARTSPEYSRSLSGYQDSSPTIRPSILLMPRAERAAITWFARPVMSVCATGSAYRLT